MKYLILLLICILSFVSCGEGDNYYVKYVVFYPSYNDTISSVYRLHSAPYVSSYQGSNRIEGRGGTIYQTSAPIKLLDYRKLE